MASEVTRLAGGLQMSNGRFKEPCPVQCAVGLPEFVIHLCRIGLGKRPIELIVAVLVDLLYEEPFGQRQIPDRNGNRRKRTGRASHLFRLPVDFESGIKDVLQDGADSNVFVDKSGREEASHILALRTRLNDSL
jgi:hypothetical protein